MKAIVQRRRALSDLLAALPCPRCHRSYPAIAEGDPCRACWTSQQRREGRP
jgi:hypothetical protein